MRHDDTWIHPNDLKYVPKDADPDFDPEHNKYVIEKTIRDSEAAARRKQKEFDEQLKERTEATAMYLEQMSGKGMSAEAYFGRGELARLRGMEIIKKLKAGVEAGEKLIYSPDK